VNSANTDIDVAVIDPGLLAQIAQTDPGPAPPAIRFTGYEPVSPQAVYAWKNTFADIRDAVLGDPEAASQPLLAGAAARLLVATALAVFPNNTCTDPTIEDRHDAHSATLARAVAFIDEPRSRSPTSLTGGVWPAPAGSPRPTARRSVSRRLPRYEGTDARARTAAPMAPERPASSAGTTGGVHW
jgi:hypothetical protein